ncbi:MAG: glycoside hydrolase family 5 protein [Opitutaceae bacterium]|jgi:hypothetical protein|nr:glycoside hydrolase family 5 protein [Opitutaceae bacterium]
MRRTTHTLLLLALTLTLALASPPTHAATDTAKKTRAKTKPAPAKQYDMASPVIRKPPPEMLPPPLRVAGNQILTPDGAPVWLQGLCIDSLEWSHVGERVVQSVITGVYQWKANAIRLPVQMHTESGKGFWFGKSIYQKDEGKRYREVVDSAVNAAAGLGAYLIIDLHGFRAPTAETLEFWKDVATRYKNHPAVIFELFNEPHDITWQIWRDGGDVTDSAQAGQDVVAENKEKLKTFQAVGMQQLVDVIRATGAKNVIIAGGIDWSGDISGVLKGYALDDRDGNGIIYTAHVYPWKKDWQGHFLDVAEKHPVLIGEVGAIRAWEDFSFIGPDQRYPLEGWAEDMIGCIQKYKLHWTAFSFHPRCGPMIISDWEYTPTPYWGVYVKDALVNGKKFEMKNPR